MGCNRYNVNFIYYLAYVRTYFVLHKYMSIFLLCTCVCMCVCVCVCVCLHVHVFTHISLFQTSVTTRLGHPDYPGQPGHILPESTESDLLYKISRSDSDFA